MTCMRYNYVMTQPNCPYPCYLAASCVSVQAREQSALKPAPAQPHTKPQPKGAPKGAPAAGGEGPARGSKKQKHGKATGQAGKGSAGQAGPRGGAAGSRKEPKQPGLKPGGPVAAGQTGKLSKAAFKAAKAAAVGPGDSIITAQAGSPAGPSALKPGPAAPAAKAAAAPAAAGGQQNPTGAKTALKGGSKKRALGESQPGQPVKKPRQAK